MKSKCKIFLIFCLILESAPCILKSGMNSSACDHRLHYHTNLGPIINDLTTFWSKENISTGFSCMFPKLTHERLYCPISIYFQDEHTVVRAGGTNMPSDHIPSSFKTVKDPNIQEAGDNPYVLAYNNAARMDSSDIIIEYSSMNIENYKGRLDSKCTDNIVYLPPLPFDYNVVIRPERTKYEVVASFGFIPSYGDRRSNALEQVRDWYKVPITNTKFSSLDELVDIYDNAKILMNVHQSYWHHTLEEFRVLPALQRGIIVISEIIPMPDTVPYSKYILFEKLDKLPELIYNVSQNYEKYWNDIFSDGSEIEKMLRNILANNTQKLQSLHASALTRYNENPDGLSNPIVRAGLIYRECFEQKTKKVLAYSDGRLVRCVYRNEDDWLGTLYSWEDVTPVKLLADRIAIQRLPFIGNCINPDYEIETKA